MPSTSCRSSVPISVRIATIDWAKPAATVSWLQPCNELAAMTCEQGPVQTANAKCGCKVNGAATPAAA